MKPSPLHRASAKKLGISPETYAAHVARGERWCSGCKTWHERSAFGRNRYNADGLAYRCKTSDARRKRGRRSERRPEPRVLGITTEGVHDGQ